MNEVDSLKAIIDSLSTIQSSIPVDVVDTLSNSNTGIDFYYLSPIITVALGIITILAYMVHNVKSVKPLLRIDKEWDGTLACTYKMLNLGLGPAIIKSIVIFWNNKAIKEIKDEDIFKCLTTDCPDEEKLPRRILYQGLKNKYGLNTFSKEEPLGQNETYNLFVIYFGLSLPKDISIDSIELIDKCLKKYLSVKITYKSIYNYFSKTVTFPDKEDGEIRKSKEAQLNHDKK